MKKFLIITFVVSLFYGCAGNKENIYKSDENFIIQKYSNVHPKKWSENIDGVIKNIPTNEKVLALTLDLCGSKNDSLDEDLVTFLIENEIPVTFFVNYRWIIKHPEKFKKLYSNPLFEIENHGWKHIPASLNGKSIYGIKGTEDAKELYDEVIVNADLIEKTTERRPKFFRSGTAYYDEYAVAQIYDMDFKTIGFNILGDAGATYSAKQVEQALLKSKPSDIIIAHANHPEKETGKGLKSVLPMLKAMGFKFVKLEDYLK
ncbi:MAG: polysaccharide deacetylase family protein [Alphaproteobacteria bacterium]|nr:polysaccharide deacetylase family protein [Alphaproteobacteria bacterium]